MAVSPEIAVVATSENVYLYVIGVVLVVVQFLSTALFAMWRGDFNDLKKDLKILSASCSKCAAELPDKYATWQALSGEAGIITELKRDRDAWRLKYMEGQTNLIRDISCIKTDLAKVTTNQAVIMEWKKRVENNKHRV